MDIRKVTPDKKNYRIGSFWAQWYPALKVSKEKACEAAIKKTNESCIGLLVGNISNTKFGEIVEVEWQDKQTYSKKAIFYVKCLDKGKPTIYKYEGDSLYNLNQYVKVLEDHLAYLKEGQKALKDYYDNP